MKYLLMLSILFTVSGCVAEFPADGRYDDRDHYDRDHDHNGWDNRRHDGNNGHRDHDDH